jgi:hypothetical protein
VNPEPFSQPTLACRAKAASMPPQSKAFALL